MTTLKLALVYLLLIIGGQQAEILAHKRHTNREATYRIV